MYPTNDRAIASALPARERLICEERDLDPDRFSCCDHIPPAIVSPALPDDGWPDDVLRRAALIAKPAGKCWCRDEHQPIAPQEAPSQRAVRRWIYAQRRIEAFAQKVDAPVLDDRVTLHCKEGCA